MTFFRARIGLTALVAGWLGCGGAQAGGEALADHPEMAVEMIEGLRFATIPRSTPGLVHLALFVDAGSRDASPPQVATVAAWAASADLSPDVLPDGSVFETTCERDALDTCMRALAATLRTRSSDLDLTSALQRLESTRRRARTDDGETADLLALAALFDDDARSFSPLGEAEDDAEVTSDAVASFYREHYGPARATLVAAGDVAGQALRDAVARAFRGAPPAATPRTERRLDADAGVSTRVAVGEATVVSAALATRDSASATAIARRIAHSFGSGSSRIRIHGFGVRGGGLVMVRLSGRRPADAGHHLVALLGAAALEAPPADTLPLPTSPRDAARVLGNAWIGRDQDTDPDADDIVSIGVGAVVAGGRGDDPSREDPDAAVLARATEHLRRATDVAWAELTPALEGERSATGAAQVLAENGARIDVIRRPADAEVAIAVRFIGGGSADPPSLHGRAALLAELSATGCGARSAPALREHLRGLGASIAPIVDAESHGVVLRGPRENAFALVELGLTCGLTPSLERADLVEARLSAIARVDAIEAVAAGALAPNAPGHIAPGGTVGTIQSVSAAALRRELEASRVGARASVAVVGAVDVEAVVPRIARRLAALAAGTLPSPRPTVDPEASEIIAFEADGSMPRVIVSFLIRDPTPPSVVAASAFAAEIARALSATRGITLVGVRAGEIQNASWLAVAVDVDVAHLDTMPERVRIAVERAKQQPLDTVLARARSETRWAEAEPAVVVMRLSRERLFGPTASRDESDFMGLGEPIFAIGHPR